MKPVQPDLFNPPQRQPRPPALERVEPMEFEGEGCEPQGIDSVPLWLRGGDVDDA